MSKSIPNKHSFTRPSKDSNENDSILKFSTTENNRSGKKTTRKMSQVTTPWANIIDYKYLDAQKDNHPDEEKTNNKQNLKVFALFEKFMSKWEEKIEKMIDDKISKILPQLIQKEITLRTKVR